MKYMIRKIYKKADKLLENKFLAKVFGAFSFLFPGLKKNILLNKKEIAQGKIELKSLPYKGNLSLTDVCNYRCKFCEIHYICDKFQRQFNNFIGKDIVSKFYPLISKMQTLSFYGAFGEPLLNPYFPEVVQFLKEKNSHIRLSVNTNGSLLTNKAIKALVESNFDDILISIHASSEQTYQNLVGGNYERVLENIRKLVESRNEKGSHLKIGLTFALNKKNASDALKYPDLGKELQVDYININHYYDVRNKLDKDVSFYFDPQKGNEILKKVYQRAKEIEIEITPTNPLFLKEYDMDLRKEYEKGELKANDCYEPFCTLKMKGCVEKEDSQYISPCNRIAFLRMNYQDYEFKDLKKDIWNHPCFLHLRKTVNADSLNPICRFCKNKMTPIIRCLDNELYRELRDKAVRDFLSEVKQNYDIPLIKGLEMLEQNPYE